MTVLYFLLGIVLLGLLILLVVGPIREGVVDDSWEEDLDALPPERRREIALEELRQARFEYEAEKLPEEDYRRIRTRWGRVLLQAEEELGVEEAPGPGAVAEADVPASEAGAPEEAETSAEARGAGAPGTASGGDEAPGGEPCPECGALPKPGARFCSRCGSRLPEKPAAAEGSVREDASGSDAGDGAGPEAGGGA